MVRKIERDPNTGALIILSDALEHTIVTTLRDGTDTPAREDTLEELLHTCLQKLREAQVAINTIDLQNFRLRNKNRILVHAFRGNVRKGKGGSNAKQNTAVPF